MNTAPDVQRRIHDAALRLFADHGARQVSVSELAHAAGVARGTIYNHIASPALLFETLAADLASDMNERVAHAVQGEPDPARRLARGIQLYVLRSHEEPAWGRFMTNFGLNAHQPGERWSVLPEKDLRHGLDSGRFNLDSDQLPSCLALIGSAVIAAMHVTLEGLRTWREAGSDTAEYVLRALGLDADEASLLARQPLRQQPGGH